MSLIIDHVLKITLHFSISVLIIFGGIYLAGSDPNLFFWRNVKLWPVLDIAIACVFISILLPLIYKYYNKEKREDDYVGLFIFFIFPLLLVYLLVGPSDIDLQKIHMSKESSLEILFILWVVNGFVLGWYEYREFRTIKLINISSPKGKTITETNIPEPTERADNNFTLRKLSEHWSIMFENDLLQDWSTNDHPNLIFIRINKKPLRMINIYVYENHNRSTESLIKEIVLKRYKVNVKEFNIENDLIKYSYKLPPNSSENNKYHEFHAYTGVNVKNLPVVFIQFTHGDKDDVDWIYEAWNSIKHQPDGVI